MMVNVKRIKILANIALLVMCLIPDAQAFPLLCSDLSRLAASAKVTMNNIMIIKQEVDNNLRIVREIQNGGFAAAGAMIFSKIQNTELDRFGNMLADAKSKISNLSDNVQDRLKQVESEIGGRYKDEYDNLLSAKNELQNALDEVGLGDELRKREESFKSSRAVNSFTNSYNWLQDNKVSKVMDDAQKSVENNVSDTITDAKENAQSALDDALSGTWSKFDDIENTIDNIAESDVEATINEKWSDVVSEVQKKCEECHRIAREAAEKAAKAAGKVGLSMSDLLFIDRQCSKICSSGS